MQDWENRPRPDGAATPARASASDLGAAPGAGTQAGRGANAGGDAAPDASASSPSAPRPPAASAEALAGDLVAELYGAAVDPRGFERLVDAWDRAAAAPAPAAGIFAPLPAAIARRHAAQAERIYEAGAAYPAVERLFTLHDHLPAFLLAGDGAVLRANAKAEALLSGLSPAERRSRIAALQAPGPAPTPAAGGIARRVSVPLDGEPPATFAALFDPADTARAAERMGAAFGLTEAETAVLALSLQALPRKRIALIRGVSPETVKKQIERVLAKTGAGNRAELTLFGAAMQLDAAQEEALAEAEAQARIAAPEGAPPGTPDGTPPGTPDTPAGACRAPARPRGAPLPYFADERALIHEGRAVTWRSFGDPGGAPLLFFHGTYGFCRWPAAAEAEAARRGVRAIIPIRPGYGGTDPGPDGARPEARIFADIDLILAAEGVAAPVHVVSLENDSWLALSWAAQAPARAARITAFAGVLPITRDAQFRRMDKWHRVVVGAARHTPALLPVIVRGGFHFAARAGREAFVARVYDGSPPDRALMRRPEAREAILSGARIAMSPRRLAHRAYAAEMIAFARGDWAAAVAALEGRVPVRFVNGATDPIAPPETIGEFRADHPWISFELHEDAGQFVFFSHWRRMFEAAQDPA